MPSIAKTVEWSPRICFPRRLQRVLRQPGASYALDLSYEVGLVELFTQEKTGTQSSGKLPTVPAKRKSLLYGTGRKPRVSSLTCLSPGNPDSEAPGSSSQASKALPSHLIARQPEVLEGPQVPEKGRQMGGFASLSSEDAPYFCILWLNRQ